MSHAEILFVITLGSFCIGILHRVWLVSAALGAMRHSFEKQDIRLENLVDRHELGFNGFRERVEHTSDRLKREMAEISTRLDDIESFLVKTTEFTRRR